MIAFLFAKTSGISWLLISFSSLLSRIFLGIVWEPVALSEGSVHPVIASSELEFLNNVKSRFFGNLGICAEVEFTVQMILFDVQTVFLKPFLSNS